jgi:hypothetical protein
MLFQNLSLYSKRRLNPTETKLLRRHRPCKLMMIAAFDGPCAPALSDGRVGDRPLDFSISCYFRVERYPVMLYRPQEDVAAFFAAGFLVQ